MKIIYAIKKQRNKNVKIIQSSDMDEFSLQCFFKITRSNTYIQVIQKDTTLPMYRSVAESTPAVPLKKYLFFSFPSVD